MCSPRVSRVHCQTLVRTTESGGSAWGVGVKGPERGAPLSLRARKLFSAVGTGWGDRRGAQGSPAEQLALGGSQLSCRRQEPGAGSVSPVTRDAGSRMGQSTDPDTLPKGLWLHPPCGVHRRVPPAPRHWAAAGGAGAWRGLRAHALGTGRAGRTPASPQSRWR